MAYQDLEGTTQQDFVWNRKDEYQKACGRNGEIPLYLLRRKKAKPEPRNGKKCPGCGCYRSISNKCICNE